MKQVSIAAAKSQFSKLVKEVENGEQVVITRDGRPAVVLMGINDDVHSGEGSPVVSKAIGSSQATDRD
jgi:prevent-host-death family protein